MRTMFDSTSAGDVPDGSHLVMGYVDGSSAWSDADFARFEAQGRIIVRLCIWNNRYDADVIDLEPKNNDARGAVPWIREKWLRGDVPTVYCFTDRGPGGYRISDVREECDAVGLKHPLFLLTDFDNDPTLPDDPEVVGKQYANEPLTGGHYDASVVRDFWPGVDKEGPVAELPKYDGKSADVVMPPGDVALLQAFFIYPDGRRVKREVKVQMHKPDRYIVPVFPRADPDADETELRDAQPAIFVIDVSPEV